ncbi:MAG: Rieske 2Fe-2S domain-containing protein [Mariprofundaceae bacterium]|nr:Rieske 2Fe-2S domain-containing protein [Mariprofundaceae bacterium]
MAEWIDVVEEAAFPVGERKVIQSDAGAILIFHLSDAYYAIEDRCSHDGGDIGLGVCEDDEIICPRHGARFCIKTGEALTPPAFEEIDVFSMRVHEGMVQVDIDS